MIKVVCDRCGEVFDFRSLGSQNKLTIISGFIRKEYDLCDACLGDVKRFIEQTERSE